jgi:hypothetical protein
MEEKKTRRRRRRGEWKSQDFVALLRLPERLARYLREMLHLDVATWNFALDKIRRGQAYKEWSKSKGRGKGRRKFAAPCEELKTVQRAILQRFLHSVPVHFVRHGNQAGSSILTNAAAHAGSRHVFTVDIVNAFPSVYRSRIRANRRKPFAFKLRQFMGVEFSQAPDEAWEKYAKAKDDELKSLALRRCLEHDFDLLLESLVDLVCLHDRLPQGPPTSPAILDIVCLKMDEVIWGLLEKSSTPFQRYRFTAYADDLTISSNADIPEELRTAITEAIRANGFFPHTRADKTKYMAPETGEVPVITGIVVNEDGRLTMAPNKVNQLRARLHQLLKLKRWDEKKRGVVAGTLGYIRQLYPRNPPSTIRDYVKQAEARFAQDSAAVSLKRVGMCLPKSALDPSNVCSGGLKRTAKKPAKGKTRTRAKDTLADAIEPVMADATFVGCVSSLGDAAAE